jgi:hypothetical protein
MSNVEGKLSYVEEFMNFLTEQSQPWVSMPVWTLHSQATRFNWARVGCAMLKAAQKGYGQGAFTVDTQGRAYDMVQTALSPS